MTEYKTCTKCGQSKLLEQFSKHNGLKASKSGYRSTCKSCDVEYNRLYRENNLEKVRAAKKKYVLANPEKKAKDDKKYREANKEKIAAKSKEWREANLDYCKAKSKEWRLANKELKALADRIYAANNKNRVNATSRRWRKNNPERAREVAKNSRLKNPETQRNKTAKRRATLAENGAFTVTKKEIIALLRKPCLYCNAKSEHIDHIIPISRGGRHSLGNLTGACKTCNLSKGSKFLMEWRKGDK